MDFLDLPFGVVPNAGAGQLTFLRHGQAKATMTIAIGAVGLFIDVPLQGNYELFRDHSKKPVVCSGTLFLSGDFPPPGGPQTLHFQLIVANNAQQIGMMRTDSGSMVAFTALPMRLSGCSNATIAGKYSSSANVWGLAPPGVPPTLNGYIDAADSSAMQFHPYQRPSAGPPGSGSIEGWDTVSLSGAIIPRILTGWYKVNPNCTGTVVVNDNIGSPVFHLQLFVVNDGTALQILNFDAVSPGSGLSPIPVYLFMLNLNRMNE
jgi:hypothetical protein